MKPYIVYEELVYPQVEELDRAFPWILPLGSYIEADLVEVGRMAFQGQPFGVLPAIPYGWNDSVLRLPEELLAGLVGSLAGVLVQDGWERLLLLTPQILGSEYSLPHIVRPLAPAHPLLLQPTAVVPIGHTEQHGFHLALNTDTVIAGGLAGMLGGEVTVLPTWPYGVSQHRRQFPGTLTVDARIFEDIWVAVAQALVAQGFECVFFLNAHGGNHSFLVNAVKFAGDALPDAFVYTTFLHTSFGRAWPQVQSQRRSELMGHACELETSYMLALRPDCVHMEWAVDEVDFLSSPNYAMDWVESGALIANPPWTDDTQTGSYGAPSGSSALQGQEWLEVAARDLDELVEEAHHQHRQRKLRRQGSNRLDSWRSIWKRHHEQK